MGIFIHVTRGLPKKLTDGTLYSTPTLKRVAELEEEVIVLSMKQASMPPEKEESLTAAASRIEALEQELSSTKKVYAQLAYEYPVLCQLPNASLRINQVMSRKSALSACHFCLFENHRIDKFIQNIIRAGAGGSHCLTRRALGLHREREEEKEASESRDASNMTLCIFQIRSRAFD